MISHGSFGRLQRHEKKQEQLQQQRLKPCLVSSHLVSTRDALWRTTCGSGDLPRSFGVYSIQINTRHVCLVMIAYLLEFLTRASLPSLPFPNRLSMALDEA